MKRRDVRREPPWPEDLVMDSSATLADPTSHFLRMTSGPSIFSEFGAFSSPAPPPSASSPVFAYSQKNFHISDGNLYSVLSPFQARKSGGRPSFLRGTRSCVGDTATATPTPSSSKFAPSGSSATQRPDQAANRRWKLKFHNQEMPPPYGERSRRQVRIGKPSSSRRETESETSSHSSWFESSFGDDPFSSVRPDGDSESLLSKRLKTPRRVPRRTKTVDDEDDDERDEARHRLFRNSDWDSEELSLGSKRSYNRRHVRSELSHSEDWTTEDDGSGSRGPLNLCLADRQRKAPGCSDASSGLGDFRRKSDDVERFPFDRFSHERKFAFSRFFDDFPMRSKFAPEDGCPDDGDFFRKSRAFEDEPRVLDLSMKGRDSRVSTPCGSSGNIASPSTATAFNPSPAFAQTYQVPIKTDVKLERFPPISEMLENMCLQDDDFQKNALKRYQAARERLMHTHPEMFGGWDVGRAEVVQNTKPFQVDPTEFRSKDLLECPKVPHRPRSWDVGPAVPAGATATVAFDVECRPESAEPCLETGPSLPGAFSPSVASETPSGGTVRSPSVPELSSISVYGGSRQCKGSDPPYFPVVPRPCSSCSEVPSMGRGSKPKLPESKIKVEVGGAQRPKARPRKVVPDPKPSQHANDISICKFKLIKGEHPILEEKKSFFVPMPRAPSATRHGLDEGVADPRAISFVGPSGTASAGTSCSGASAIDKFRTYKIHVGSQEEMGRKLAASKRLRRRSRKTLAREKLEATFREQGFLIKTQQVSSAEGAVYCKFRQLKKFTRYLYKSWKDHLPKELDELGRTSPAPAPAPPST